MSRVFGWCGWHMRPDAQHDKCPVVVGDLRCECPNHPKEEPVIDLDELFQEAGFEPVPVESDAEEDNDYRRFDGRKVTVLRTDGSEFTGIATVGDEAISLKTGTRGRPPKVPYDEIHSIYEVDG